MLNGTDGDAAADRTAKRQDTGEPGTAPRPTYPEPVHRSPRLSSRRRGSARPGPTRSRRLLVAAGAAALVLAVAGCGEDSPPSASDEIQERAQAGLLASYSGTYAITDTKGGDSGRVSVWRTPTTLRLDVRTDKGISTSITTPQGTVACQVPSTGKKPTCLEVAAAGATPPPLFDPVLRKVFGDALRVLGDDDNGLIVEAQPSASPTSAVSEATSCFKVTAPSTQQKIASGTYCLTADGIPTGMNFASGTVTLTVLTRAAPEASVFEPTTSPTPLPSTSS